MLRWLSWCARTWLVIIFGAVATLVGASELYRNWRDGPVAAWPSVEGRIEAADVIRGRSSRRWSNREYHYEPIVRYSYAAGGVRYSGYRISLATEPRFATPEAAEAALRVYPLGAAVRVYHAPGDPERSVLRTDAPSSDLSYVLLFGLVCLGVGYWMLKRGAKRAAGAANPPGAGPRFQ